MEKPVHMIGLDAEELGPVRLLVALLRHPDPAVGELSRQALFYLQDLAATKGIPDPEVLDCAG
jgi:hypothetical protein